jgi:UDP-N-acetylglucosamine diphosphorylase/glucosamine-1-phosphate N-acetyltransferase
VALFIWEPFALCKGATVKMQAKIYGPTTVGPSSKAGGEINNSVIQGNSNKAHDGFLGNSVIGEWCNLGADTNNSNLKNNYSEVKIWNYPKKQYIGTNRQFCGLFMGDHSKCGINTMFNTGTVVGVSANIFGSGFPGNFVPSFSWGGSSGYTTYRLDKMMETAGRVTERKGEPLHENDRAILEYIFDFTGQFRNW